jgi:hypothetical protein
MCCVCYLCINILIVITIIIIIIIIEFAVNRAHFIYSDLSVCEHAILLLLSR